MAGWPQATGANGGGQYSKLTQIDRSNVGRLKIAWTYDASDPLSASDKSAGGNDAASGGHASSGVEATPIIVSGKLVLCTPAHRVVALDPESGKEIWSFDPHMGQVKPGELYYTAPPLIVKDLAVIGGRYTTVTAWTSRAE